MSSSGNSAGTNGVGGGSPRTQIRRGAGEGQAALLAKKIALLRRMINSFADVFKVYDNDSRGNAFHQTIILTLNPARAKQAFGVLATELLPGRVEGQAWEKFESRPVPIALPFGGTDFGDKDITYQLNTPGGGSAVVPRQYEQVAAGLDGDPYQRAHDNLRTALQRKLAEISDSK